MSPHIVHTEQTVTVTGRHTERCVNVDGQRSSSPRGSRTKSTLTRHAVNDCDRRQTRTNCRGVLHVGTQHPDTESAVRRRQSSSPLDRPINCCVVEPFPPSSSSSTMTHPVHCVVNVRYEAVLGTTHFDKPLRSRVVVIRALCTGDGGCSARGERWALPQQTCCPPARRLILLLLAHHCPRLLSLPKLVLLSSPTCLATAAPFLLPLPLTHRMCQ